MGTPMNDTSIVEEINGEHFLVQTLKWDSLVGHMFITLPKKIDDVDKYYRAITGHFEKTLGYSFNKDTVDGKVKEYLDSPSAFIEIIKNPEFKFYIVISPQTDIFTGRLYTLYKGKIHYL